MKSNCSITSLLFALILGSSIVNIVEAKDGRGENCTLELDDRKAGYVCYRWWMFYSILRHSNSNFYWYYIVTPWPVAEKYDLQQRRLHWYMYSHKGLSSTIKGCIYYLFKQKKTLQSPQSAVSSSVSSARARKRAQGDSPTALTI